MKHFCNNYIYKSLKTCEDYHNKAAIPLSIKS